MKSRALNLLNSGPWAILPDALETIRAIAARENEAVELKRGAALQNTRQVSLRGGVAVIPITGPIFRYANLFTEISGATSLEILAKDFNTALEAPAVKAIVLNLNTPGGMAAGIGDFAQHIRAAKKPVVAFVDGTAASAGYWLASAASEVVISQSGLAGSIGVVLAIDTAADPEVVEIVSSQSPNKRPDANTEAGRGQIQRLVDSLAEVFVADVAAYRGKSAEQVVADFGGGDLLVGQLAVDAGLADRTGTLEGVISELQSTMRKKMDIETLRSEHPALVAELIAGLTAGDLPAALQASIRTVERERIQAIEALAIPGHEELISQMKFDGVTTGPEAAIRIIHAEKSALSSRASALHRDAPQALALIPPQDQENTLTVEDRCERDWNGSEKLRGEFPDLKTYTAFARARAAGKIRVAGGRQS